MTVTTTLDRQYFDGDGSNKVFPFNFRFFTNDQIYVSLIAPDGTITLQNLTTNYTLSGALQAGGGTVTMIVAPPLTVPATRVFVQRILPQVQPTSIRNQGKFYPEIHEDVFDRLTMLIQQALAGLSNALQLSANRLGWNFLGFKGLNVGDPTDPADAANKSYVDAVGQTAQAYADTLNSRTVRTPEVIGSLPGAAARANKFLVFDAFGNPSVGGMAGGPVTDAGSVLYARSQLDAAITTAKQMLDASAVNVYEYAGSIVLKPTADPATWDWSPAFQAANDALRAKFIALAVCSYLDVPPGRYPILSTVTISPFVKLRSSGLVIFDTYTTGTAFHFTSRADDPLGTTIYMQQQWLRGLWISGSFLFANRIGSTGSTFAIEIGPRTDTGAFAPVSRYAMCDFAVQGYNTAIKFNRFRNYIGFFYRLHLEHNNYSVQFGDAGVNVSDSGENISFYDSVFAKARTVFRWLVDGFDLHTVNCSYDYNGLMFHASRTYKTITLEGGHIEGLNPLIADDGVGGVLLEDSVASADSGIQMTVTLNNVPCIITPRKMFRGSNKVQLYVRAELRKLGTGVAPTDMFLVDSAINVRQWDVVIQQRTMLSSPRLNHIRYPNFELATPGADPRTTPPSGFLFTSSNLTGAAYVAGGPLGGNYIQCVGGASASFWVDTIEKKAVLPGQMLLGQMAVFVPTTTNIAPDIDFYIYDSADNLIEISPGAITDLGATNIVAGQWCMPAYGRQHIAPPGAAYYKVRFSFGGAALNGNPCSISSCFAAII